MKTHNTDISGNRIDVSRNLLFTTTELSIFNEKSVEGNMLNSDFFNLHDCKDECENNFFSLDLLKKNIKNSIKGSTNNSIFNMPLDTLLERIRQTRNDNYKDIPYKRIIKQLDGNDTITSLPTHIDKDRLDTLLDNVTKHYNNFTFGKPLTSYKPPRFKSRYRRRSILALPSIPPPPPPPPLPPRIVENIHIDVSIDTLGDLIKLCDDYPLRSGVKYNINMKAIHQIKEPLVDLDSMIGMNNLKNSILDQILYFIQDLHKCSNKSGKDFMHTVIYGPPGTGKTEVAKIMGKIFSKMGVLPKNVFKKATRADLIAGYLGQTALKTKDLIKECLGGVLFIDEAYALGNSEKRDSFAKECIDTLCEALSDNKENLMVIIAGYEKELKECFFNYNQGLDSRFTWRFRTTDYTPGELKAIFEKKVDDAKWIIKEPLPESWFKKNKDYFKFFGRDMETLFAKTKIAHGRRIFGKKEDERKKITIQDLDKGFDMYCANDEVNGRCKNDETYASLYL